MNVSVLISTFNRAESLRRTLHSLASQRVPPGLLWEVVVIDNNSHDHTSRVVQEAAREIPCHYVFESRAGKSRALNTGIWQAHGDVLVFTDDDVEFGPNWLMSIAEPFEAADVMGVGGRIEAVWPGPAPEWWCASGPFRLHSAVVHFDLGPESIDLRDRTPVGANMAFRRQVFERVGGFREDLGPKPGYPGKGEDTEMATRVVQAGGRVVYVPSALVYHPVERRRARKSYFRHWCFDYGRSIVRRQETPSPCVYWFGVPRFLYRQLARAVFKATMRALSQEAFYWQLKVVEVAGVMYEFRRLRQENATASEHARTDTHH